MATIVTRAGKGSALTWTEGDANITNLNNAKIENVVEDTSPQLGGDLDVNGKQIVSADNGNINIVPNGSGNINLTPATGHVTISATNFPTGTGTSGQVLQTDGTGNATWATPAAGGLAHIVEDTTPQLGGALDTLGNVITTSIANGDVTLTALGTGSVKISNTKLTVGTSSGTVTSGSGGALTITANAGSTSGTITVGSGANQNIIVQPNGTGKTITYGLTYRESIYAVGTTTTTSYNPYPFNGNTHTITVNAATWTLNGASTQAGESVTIFLTGGTTAPTAITQSATGTWKWAGGSKVLSGVTGTTDVISLFNDGTTYYVSINKGFV